ncbi:hypothetical protein ACWV26_19080 [Rummeliibacillus sp. JY-2-4R]
MERREKLNEEAALNNNLDSATYLKNPEIAKLHEKPKTDKLVTPKMNDKKIPPFSF